MSPSSPGSDDSNGMFTAEGPLSVLLIEDNPGDARLFEELLGESAVGATFRHEETLDGGLTALREDPPDVLAIDLGLPDSEGTETVRAAASAGPPVPIVVLTGRDNLEVALQAQKAGAAEYLQKGELTPGLLGRTLRWAVERTRMRDKLRQRDAWIRSISENVAGGLFRVGPTGRIEYANRGLARMLGVEEEAELIGRDLTAFYANPVQRGPMLAEDGASGVEIKLERTDGSVLVGLLSAEAAYDAEGQVLHYDGVITNITERAEQRQRLRMLSEAVEQAREAVLITEPEPLEEPGPRIEYVNAAFEEMTGYSEGEVLGKTPRILQGPDTDREVLDSLREALEAGEEWEGETVNYRKGGESYRVQWNVSPVTDDSGEIEHWVSVQRDVTEGRKREKRLARMAQALDQVGDKVAITDRKGHIQYVNSAFEEMTGYTEEEVLGRTPAVLQPKEQGEAFYEELWDTIQSGETFRAEFANETKDGTRYVEDETISPVTNEEGEITHFVSSGRDVTERKEREEYLAVTLQSIGDAVVATDREGCVVEMNSVAERLTGWKQEEAEGKLLDDILTLHSARTGETIESPAEKVLREGTTVGLANHTVLTSRGGTEYQIADSAAPIQSEEGDLLGVVMVFRDVTEKYQRRRRMERQNDLFAKTQDLAKVGGWEYDVETGVHLWTDEVYQIYGLPKSFDPTVQEGIAHYHPDDRPTIREVFTRAVEEGEPYDVEVRLIGAEGEEKWVRTRGEPQVEDGDIVRIRGSIQDITERKRREERLEEMYERMELALDYTSSIIFEIDLESDEVSRTGAYEKFFGMPSDEVKTREQHVNRAVHPDDRADFREFYRALARGERTSGALEYRTNPDFGESRWIRDNVHRIEGENRLLGLALDVTERRNREERLREAKAEAEEAARLKSTMLANMSHEIRTPLTAINGFTEILTEELSGEIEVMAERAHQGGKRLMRTLNSVLELSQLEAGTYDLDREHIRLQETVEGTAQLLASQAEDKGVSLTTSCEADPVGAWDDATLNRICENLVGNALKFTPEGGQVTVRVSEEGDEAILEVEDTGIGISEAALPKVFEPFEQESEGLSREYEGTGLGLSIARRLTEALNGTIEVETEKGEGTCFMVRLPKRPGPPRSG